MAHFASQPFADASLLIGDPAGLRETAAEQGYLYFPGLIETGTVRQLRSRVLTVCRELGWLAPGRPEAQGIARPDIKIGDYEDPNYLALLQRIMPLPEFTALGRHAGTLDILEKLFGGPVEGDKGSVLRVFSPHHPELATPAHQDRYYLHNMPDLWTVWQPLGACPAEMGGLAVLPGSHREGILAHDGEGIGDHILTIAEEAVWATGDYGWGDVLMFNNLTVHRAGVNRSIRLRLSADYRYRPKQG
jgi:hypothetical protein